MKSDIWMTDSIHGARRVEQISRMFDASGHRLYVARSLFLKTFFDSVHGIHTLRISRSCDSLFAYVVHLVSYLVALFREFVDLPGFLFTGRCVNSLFHLLGACLYLPLNRIKSVFKLT